ncbi:MAG: hypothetical protein OXG81_03170 [Acidobacteria bacterium]|nr:hypothetical protein [Acidobacteriota bacterium]
MRALEEDVGTARTPLRSLRSGVGCWEGVGRRSLRVRWDPSP